MIGFVLLPNRLGDYTAHAVYFWPSALLITAFLYGVGPYLSQW
jgi:hypothetical protein